MSEISTEPHATPLPEGTEAPPAVETSSLSQEASAADPQPEIAAEPQAAEAADTPGVTEPAPQTTTPEAQGPGPAAIAKLLAERFPAVFGPGQAKPLKLKIQADIQARLETPPSRKVLSIVLQRHTTSTAYLRAMSTATQRFDLDGQPAGELAEEHRSAAQVEVERRRAIVAGKRAAEREAERAAQRDQQRDQQREQQREQREQQRAQQQTQRAAQAEVHAQREAEGAERAARATLLRAFETTTLTRANFCALKGIAEPELDAVLARAREERAQRLAAVPRQDASAPQAGPGLRPAQGDGPPRGDRPQGPRPPRREGRPPRRGPAPA